MSDSVDSFIDESSPIVPAFLQRQPVESKSVDSDYMVGPTFIGERFAMALVIGFTASEPIVYGEMGP